MVARERSRIMLRRAERSLAGGVSSNVRAGTQPPPLFLDAGVRVIPRGLWYISTVHTEGDVEFTLKAVNSALRELYREEVRPLGGKSEVEPF